MLILPITDERKENIFLILISKIATGKINFYAITTIMVFGIGAMFLLFAPENFARLSTTGGTHLSFTLILQNIMGILKILLAYGLSIILMMLVKVRTRAEITYLLKNNVYFSPFPKKK